MGAGSSCKCGVGLSLNETKLVIQLEAIVNMAGQVNEDEGFRKYPDGPAGIEKMNQDKNLYTKLYLPVISKLITLLEQEGLAGDRLPGYRRVWSKAHREITGNELARPPAGGTPVKPPPLPTTISPDGVKLCF